MGQPMSGEQWKILNLDFHFSKFCMCVKHCKADFFVAFFEGS